MPRRRQPKIALVTIGINYKKQRGELRGCINDSNNVLKLARRHMRGRLHCIRQLIDHREARQPTRRNIELVLRRVVRHVKRNGFTHLIVHYSGHGTQVRDRTGEEQDRKDEALVPVDWRRRGVITDDWLMRHVIQPLPKHVAFFGLFDCCHSGTVLDLKHAYEPVRGGRRLRAKRGNLTRPTACAAVLISGCRDHKYSYDVRDRQYGAAGAMSSAFLRAMLRGRQRPIGVVVDEMRRELRRKRLPQIPQLSASRPIHARQRVPGWGV